MVVVDWPHPDYNFSTSNYADTLPATHFQIHASSSHFDGTPDGGQNNAIPVTVV